MRELTPREQEVAEALAFALADVFWQRMPSLFAEPPEVVIGITLPLACSLVRLEAKAARNKKHAKKYRRVQREVRALLRTEPASPVPVSALSQTIAFDPGQWHAELRPGAGHEALYAGDAP